MTFAAGLFLGIVLGCVVTLVTVVVVVAGSLRNDDRSIEVRR